MIKINSHKRVPKCKAGTNEQEQLPLEVAVPVYACAVVLIAVYGWSGFQKYPWPVAMGLLALYSLGEGLKPQIGRLLGEAIDLNDWRTFVLVLPCAFAAIGIGAFGSHSAIEAAALPAIRYQALIDAEQDTSERLTLAQNNLDRVSSCTPDMPAVRCRAFIEQNANAIADSTRIRDDARADHDAARQQLDAAPNPGPGISPQVQALAPIGGALIEFLVFIVPLAFVMLRRKRQARETPQQPKQAAPKPQKQAPQKAAPSAAEIAKKGWEGEAGEKRRAALAARNRSKHLKLVKSA